MGCLGEWDWVGTPRPSPPAILKPVLAEATLPVLFDGLLVPHRRLSHGVTVIPPPGLGWMMELL